MTKYKDYINYMESDASDKAHDDDLTHMGGGNWSDATGHRVAYTDDAGQLQYVDDDSSDDLEQSADEFAQRVHGDQQYGIHPYKYHLDKVVGYANKFNGTPTQKLAARLHDTIEDTSVTKAEVASRFGPEVAEVVDLVSNLDKTIPNWKRLTYERVRSNPDAVFVKLCDRMANTAERGKIEKYKKEYPLFKQVLHREGEYDEMWSVLDRLHDL